MSLSNSRTKPLGTLPSARTSSKFSTSSTHRCRSRRGMPGSAVPAVPIGRVATVKVAIGHAAKRITASHATNPGGEVATIHGTMSIHSTGPRTGVTTFQIRGTFPHPSWKRYRRIPWQRGNSISWTWRGISGKGRLEWGTLAIVHRSSNTWSNA